MDIAFIVKLAIENNGVKCLQVRQDLFERILYAKGTKTKDSEEIVPALPIVITKKQSSQKEIGLTVGQSLLERLKNFVMLKYYKFTLQGLTRKPHLLKVQ